MSARSELTGVAGVPETAISEDLVATLPGNEAPAPWTCRSSAVLWVGRGGRAAANALPAELRGGPLSSLATLGGLVRYEDTPVGAYDEVLGIVASRSGAKPWGHVAFMAVDSPTSLVGGRTNWAMPKALAGFEGGIGDGETMVAAGEDGHSWRVTASAKAIGPAIPIKMGGFARQVFPGGVVKGSKLLAGGRIRPALVTVKVESQGPLRTWLRSGRHLGAIAEGVEFSLGEPQPV